MDPDLQQDSARFDDVLVTLIDAGARFLVTGGVAVVLHGYCRRVADLDLVADPRSADFTANCLASLGFVASLPLPLSMVSVMRFFDGQGREVDLNVRYPVAFPDLIARAATFPVAGRGVPVISIQDLIAVKGQRGRDYDVDDVEGFRDALGIDGS